MKTSGVFVRIEPDLKTQAEQVLSDLGLSISGAINLFFKQIVLNQGLPFAVRKPKREMCYELMTEEEMMESLGESEKELDEGKGIDAETAFADFNKKHGI